MNNRTPYRVFAAFAAVLLAAEGSPTEQNQTPGSPTFTVTGSVTDSEGVALAGAQVWLVHQVDGTWRVEQQRTEVDGRYEFRLSERFQGRLAVLAFNPGHAIGFASQSSFSPLFPSDRLRADDALELPIRLGAATPLSVALINADGQPARQCELQFEWLSSEGDSVRLNHAVELAGLTRLTDDQGNAVLDYLPAEGTIGLRAVAADGAPQTFSLSLTSVDADARQTLKLLPSARVNVELLSDDADVITDRRVTITSRPTSDQKKNTPAAESELIPVVSSVTVEMDARGKATAAVAAGSIDASVLPKEGSRSFPTASDPVVAQGGESVAIRLAFSLGTRVSGLVRTPQGEPVTGVRLSLNGTRVASGEDGRFTAWVPSGVAVRGLIRAVPQGICWPYESWVYLPAPEAASSSGGATATRERQLPDIVVRRAQPVRGIAVNENGEPVAGATVKADWVQQHDKHSYFTLKSDFARTDADGQFTLWHTYPDVDARVTASTGETSVMQATNIRTGNPSRVELVVSSEGMVQITGRAMAEDGTVIAGATVAIVRAVMGPNGHEYGTRPVEFRGRPTFAADEDGHFRSPGDVPRAGKYAVTISAPGYMAVETTFLSPPESTPTFDLGEMILDRARSVSGMVQDFSGQPLAGVRVSAHAAPQDRNSQGAKSETLTDADGHFTLDQLHPRAAVLVAEKEGYRLSGAALRKDAGDIRIPLFRTGEPVAADDQVRPRLLNDTQRHAAALKLISGLVESRRGSSYFHGRLLEMLVRIDPERALEEVARSGSAATRAKTLARLDEMPDALAELETITDAYSRAFARFQLIEHCEDGQQAAEQLAAAMLDARTVRRPDRRAVIVANVAEHFAQRDNDREAADVLAGELRHVKALGKTDWPGYARGTFASQLARYNLPTALTLIKGLTEQDQTRHFQNTAHLLANLQPEQAEQLVKEIDEHRYVDAPAVRVAYRMAQVDLARALRLLESIDVQQRPTEKARGLGVIAYAIRDTDPQKSRELLGEAFETLPPQSGTGGSRTDDIFGAAIMLLRLAEVVDPDRLTQYFWITVKNYGGPEAHAWSPDDAAEENADRQAQLALLLSLYSAAPDVSEQIMAPVFEYWEQQIGKNTRFNDAEATFLAMALSDPQRAVDWALRFERELDDEHRRIIPQPWTVIGDGLTMDRNELGKFITRHVYHRWIIDQYDL